MARINLLPWREEKRQLRENNFYTGLGVAVAAGLLLLVMAYMQISAMISYQESRNAYLNTEIKQVEKAIAEIQNLQKKKKALLERMEVIKKFQSNRSDSVKLLDEVVKVLPDGLHLTSYTQKQKTQNFAGVAQSNARVSAFMRNIERSEWLTSPNLQVIKAQGIKANKRYKYSTFNLDAEQIVSDISEAKK